MATAPASGPQAPEPDRAFQDRAWGADKQARLNSVSSPVLRVIMMPCASLSALPCPALPCLARPSQGALHGRDRWGLQQHLGLGGRPES